MHLAGAVWIVTGVLGLSTATAACDDAGSHTAAPDAAPPDGAPDVPAPVMDRVTGSIYDLNPGAAPIAGAKVCVLHHADIPCGITDAAGSYAMMLPDLQGKDIAISVTAEGWLGYLATIEQPVDIDVPGEHLHTVVWPSGLPLYSSARATQFLATQAGFTFPGAGTGFLVIRIDGATIGSLTGATATVTPVSGAGPVYTTSQGVPDPSLTGTSTSDGVLFGNLAPGEYEVTARAAGKTCSVIADGGLLAGSWPPRGSGTVRVEVAADSFTEGVHVQCR